MKTIYQSMLDSHFSLLNGKTHVGALSRSRINIESLNKLPQFIQ